MGQMSETRPSRAAVAHIYAKRAIRWRRNSYPFISGDAFADFADFVYHPPRFRDFNKVPLNQARIIFARSHDLEELFEEKAGEINASVIITGNSDFEFHSHPKNIPDSVGALFLQNSFITDNERFFSIPLGLENFRLGVNGNPKFIQPRKFQDFTNRKVLFGPFGKTHQTRELVTSSFGTDSQDWDFLSTRLDPGRYDKLAKQYSHIASVRGNGVDTHRLWESLYRGITPIVERSIWWDSLSNYFPEVEVVDSWTPQNIDLLLSREKAPIRVERNPALWMNFWISRISQYVD